MITSTALAGFVVGPALAHFGITRPLIGFVIFALSMIVCTISGVAGGVALLRGKPVGGPQWIAMAIALFFVVTLVRGSGVPRINDFTTDVADPPAFKHAATLPPNVGRDLSYPADFATQQQACCPDLHAALVPGTPDAAFARAKAMAEQHPTWTVTAADAAAGTIEAVSTSWLFRFEDDVVLRVRPGDGGRSRVDVRSKSRDGKGDMGVNAARIREVVQSLERAGA